MRLSGIKIVVADDNPELLFTLQSVLENEGAEVVSVEDGQQALVAIREHDPHLVILDVVMPNGDGLSTTETIKSDSELRYIPVVLLSSKDELNDISSGIQRGADDYIRKPFRQEELVDRLIAVLRTGELYKELRDAKSESAGAGERRYAFEFLLGKSQALEELSAKIEQYKSSSSAVLVLGESGTGKELVAKALHHLGPRKGSPFVVQNCAAIQESLLESELFGHVKGSFTGAIRDRKGLFETADGGTLFLDEIGELASGLQAKLLRALQDGSYTPIGSSEQRSSNVRILAATHRNLWQMVQEGTFREDLYYRLKVLTISIPPLRERKEDIPLLVEEFLKKSCQRNGCVMKSVSEEALSFLQSYDWPGNVRELENEIERLVVVSGTSTTIGVGLLSAQLFTETPKSAEVPKDLEELPLKDALSALEKKMIEKALEESGGNKSEAARILGVSRSNLIAKVKAYGLEDE